MKFKFILLVLAALPLFSFHSYNTLLVETPATKNSIGNEIKNKNSDRLDTIDSLLQTSDLVIIDFWYAGCAPCRKSIPEINEIYKEYDSKKVKIYGLNARDEIEQINRYKEMMKVMYPLIQVSSFVIQKYYVSEYPTLMIFKKGKPVMTIEGYSSLLKQQIKASLDKN
jgi:thiol-disulfide isomerase/thioredoxin